VFHIKATKPELWLLLNKGVKPNELVKIGYNKATVYKYNELFHDVWKKYKKNMEQIKKLRVGLR
jgi:hypothetical protein